jgi:hypothetical protein
VPPVKYVSLTQKKNLSFAYFRGDNEKNL